MSDTCSSTRVTYSTDWSYTVFMLDAGRLEWIERHKYVIKKKWNIHDRSQKQQMFCCKKEDSFSVQCTESDTNNITTYFNTNGYLKTKSAHTLHQKLSHGYVFFLGGLSVSKVHLQRIRFWPSNRGFSSHTAVCKYLRIYRYVAKCVNFHKLHFIDITKT